MTTRRIFLGNIPSADVIFTDGADPIAAMIAEGNARLNAERESAEKTRLAAIADAERAEKTRAARRLRRMRKALRWVF